MFVSNKAITKKQRTLLPKIPKKVSKGYGGVGVSNIREGSRDT